MIAQLSGKFLYKTPTQLIMDVGGVGYEVNISLNTYTTIQNKEEGALFTYLRVTEDALTIYGFFDLAEKQMFLQLLSVSGVGAATARMMLSSMKPVDIQHAIITGNIKLLETVKGIGKKTAERIVLELKDKVSKQATTAINISSSYNTKQIDALEALVALGINRFTAEQTLKKVIEQYGEPANIEDLIKQVLKNI